MNWLYVGIPLALAYVAWFIFIISKRKYNRQLLFIGMAHLPYLLINVVAPFRGILDDSYVGYAFGWVQLPKGPWVAIVVGSIVVCSLIIATRAILNMMEKWWTFGFLFDLVLSVIIGFPILLDILSNPAGSRIELGEYLQISGYFVALLIFIFLSGPIFLSTYLMGKKVVENYKKKSL